MKRSRGESNPLPLRRAKAPPPDRRARLGPIAQMRTQERQVGQSEAVGGGLGLVPVRVDQRRGAHFVQSSALLLREPQLGGLEVVCELIIGSRTDYDQGHARSAKQP